MKTQRFVPFLLDFEQVIAYVNPDLVRFVRESSTGVTSIYFSEEDFLVVRGESEEVAATLGEAQR